MNIEELKLHVLKCIAKKQEGDYWDFKRQWYEKDKKSSLLHDIICMANLTRDEDGYIIIGVDEEQDCKLIDVKNDPNRKNTHEMVKFLRDKPFDAGIRPTVYVENIVIRGITLDVIIIENSNYTPYYLTKRFEEVEPYHIYTRVSDSNTPIDSSADRDKVEALWKKRFGIGKSSLEKLRIYLGDYEHWKTPDGEESWYYEFAPEYRIEIEIDERRKGYEYYCFTQCNSRPSYYNLRLKYHATVMIDTSAISLDGGRFLTAVPNVKVLWDVPYYFYFTDRINYSLHRFFENKASKDYQSRCMFDSWNECVPTIGDQKETEEFFDWLKRQTIPCETNRQMVYIPEKLQNGDDGTLYKDGYKQAMIINDMLEKYWLENS